MMQKQWSSILSVAFAILALVVMHSLPHHHHGEKVCFVTICSKAEHRNADAGESPYHHHSDNSEPCNTCTVKNSYLFSFGQNDTKCKVASCLRDDHPHTHLFPVSGLTAVMLFYEATLTDEPLEYGEYLEYLYPSVDANRDNGLRAPPRFTV
jgi:hypothetical protein